MTPATIYLLRHGQTEWNAIGRFQGAMDSSLTAKGRLQAEKMAQILLREVGVRPKYDLVSSPHGRAQETAAIVGTQLGLEAVNVQDLAEITMGSWDGLTLAQIQSGWREILFHTTEENFHFHSPDGESYADVAKRVSRWLTTVERPTIAVSHGISGKVLRGVYAGLGEEQTLSQDEPQDAVHRLRHGKIELLRL